jgi:protein-tyrosine phosphatase
MIRLLFVCTGNICRSPLAEGLMRDKVAAAGLSHEIGVDSAGTHGYHVGEPPDPRAVAIAWRYGIAIGGLRARAVSGDDFRTFDLIVALDRGHLNLLRSRCPQGTDHKISLLLSFAGEDGDVPDPYYGSDADFETAYRLIAAGVDGILQHLRRRLADQ